MLQFGKLRKSENNTSSFPRFFLTRLPQRESNKKEKTMGTWIHKSHYGSWDTEINFAGYKVFQIQNSPLHIEDPGAYRIKTLM